MKDDLKRNGSGYPDPTAYRAIKNVEKVSEEDTARFRDLLDVIFTICELSGFHIEDRIVVRDKKTGKVWR